MKALLPPLLLIVLLPAALLTYCRWDSAHNRGFEYGYYGVFNRVRHALEGMPGIIVTREWANTELFDLEEFGFTVTTGTGREVKLSFGEDDATRELTGDELARTLAKKIETESAEVEAQP